MRSGITIVIGLALSAQVATAGTRKTHAGATVKLSPEALYYADTCADHWYVPRELMRAIMYHESGGSSNVVSTMNKDKNRDGQGLMQLLPSTAAHYGVANAFSPGENACGGAHYLSDLIHEFNDLREVVAAYYCGEHHIERRGLNYSNPEVVAYVKHIRALYVQQLKEEGSYDEVALR